MLFGKRNRRALCDSFLTPKLFSIGLTFTDVKSRCLLTKRWWIIVCSQCFIFFSIFLIRISRKYRYVFSFLSLGGKRTGLTADNINKSNWNANLVQNWFGLVLLAETCFNSFDRSSSLVLRYSIVLSLYNPSTTRMVGRNRTTRAQIIHFHSK